LNKTLRKVIAYCLRQKKNITIKTTATALHVSESTAGDYLHGLLTGGTVKVTQVKPIHYQIVEVKEWINSAAQCLLVYKSEFLVGYLYVAEGTYRFFYDLTYLAEFETAAISPLFPLKTKFFDSNILFSVFSQILPEGYDRRLLEAKMGTADDFSLLAEVEHNYGDLVFKACNTLLQKPIKTISPSHKQWYTK